MNIQKINGYGQLFRFITPVLITVSLFILSQIIGDLKELKVHFQNHLQEHKMIEILLEKRITILETKYGK